MNLGKFLSSHAGSKTKSSLEAIILSKLNLNRHQFEEWKRKDYSTNEHASSQFLSLIEKAKHIRIIGDYDCDGICASHIAREGIETLFPEKDIKIFIPRRFSEGYGINEHIVETIIGEGDSENTLIITVDNGISAPEVLKMAKDAGIKIALTDHHTLADDKPVPDADFVVNPSVERISNPFANRLYCGAGVIYKLFERHFPPEKREELRQFAAVATFADVMTLHEENWLMCREFMYNARVGKICPALKEMMFAAGYDPQFTDEYYLGFILGPMFNAPGRLYDDGGQIVLNYLKNPTREGAQELYDINSERKALVKEQMEKVEEYIEKKNLSEMYPLWVTVDGLHEGIVGILAGHLAEKYHRPAFVVTENEKAGCLKGSARSDGEFHIFNYLKEHEEDVTGFGGHAGAAGLRVTMEQFLKLQSLAEIRKNEEYHLPYDLTISPAEIVKVYQEMEEFRPFGEGNPMPVFKIPINLKENGVSSRYIGANGNHLSIEAYGAKMLHFGHADSVLKNPECFDMVGTIEQNIYMGKSSIQFLAAEVSDRAETLPDVEFEELDF